MTALAYAVRGAMPIENFGCCSRTARTLSRSARSTASARRRSRWRRGTARRTRRWSRCCSSTCCAARRATTATRGLAWAQYRNAAAVQAELRAAEGANDCASISRAYRRRLNSAAMRCSCCSSCRHRHRRARAARRLVGPRARGGAGDAAEVAFLLSRGARLGGGERAGAARARRAGRGLPRRARRGGGAAARDAHRAALEEGARVA